MISLRFHSMLVLLCILVFISNFGLGVYAFSGEEPRPMVEFLYSGSFLCGVVWWLRVDAQRSALSGLYCPGLLFGYGWLVMVPYHLFKTRGVRALIPLGALIFSYIAALVAALLLVFILAPERLAPQY